MSVPITKSVAILKPRGEDRVRSGHPWVYRSDIADVLDPDAGAIVEVRGPRNRDHRTNRPAVRAGGGHPEDRFWPADEGSRAWRTRVNFQKTQSNML